MRIKEGRFYVDGKGHKIGPMYSYGKDSMAVSGKDSKAVRDDPSGFLWGLDGKRFYPISRGLTCLVSEWVEPSEPEIVWGEWVYDITKWCGLSGREQYETGEDSKYLRHRIPKRERITGSVEVDSEGEPDFSTWTET